MDGRWTALVARVQGYFGVDTEWERRAADPARTRRTDTWLALAFLVTGSVGVELLRSIDALGSFQDSWVWPHVAVLAGTVPLVWRRRWPLAVAAGLSLHFFAVGLVMPGVASSVPMQVVYFVAIFTGVAWATDRRAMIGVVIGIVLLMFGWLTWQFAVAQRRRAGPEPQRRAVAAAGPLQPVRRLRRLQPAHQRLLLRRCHRRGPGRVVVGARRDRLTAQALTIDAQATSLRRQAVVEERLSDRTGAARRRRPPRLGHRHPGRGRPAGDAPRRRGRRGCPALGRDLLARRRRPDARPARTLRAEDADDTDPSTAGDPGRGGRSRAPEPVLADVPALAEEACAHGLHVECRVVEDAPGALVAVPAPLGLSLYRTVQEALANVRRHSTASAATVVVRVDRRGEPGFAHGYAEVEVLDGRPRSGTSGTGLGLLGVRERLATHGGVSEIGPRVTGGYRVRVRMPLPEEAS